MDLRELQAAYMANYHQVTEEKLCKGALVEVVISEEDGMVFKDGRKEKPKKIIIVGVDTVQMVCYGSVLINTKQSPRAPFSTEHLQAQYLIKREDYPDFLRYDSFVDCGVLWPIPISKLLKGEYYGKLKENDEQKIFAILSTTETLSVKQKKRFGIIQ